MIVASMTLGVATGVANIYDRMQYGELNGSLVTLEVMNIVGSMLAGGGKVISMLSKSAPLGKLGQFVYYTGEGLDLVDGICLTVAGADHLKQILESDMSPAQKRVEMVKAVSSLILGGYLIANVGGARSKVDEVENKNVYINIDVRSKRVGKSEDLNNENNNKVGDDKKKGEEDVENTSNKTENIDENFDINPTKIDKLEGDVQNEIFLGRSKFTKEMIFLILKQ
jgi:hypothetical protein